MKVCIGNKRAPKPKKVTWEVMLTVTDNGKDGYMTLSMLKKMLVPTGPWCYSGVKVRINAVQELPEREEV